MVKQRGFRPQGLQLNPIKRIASGGPPITEKLKRESRPTWEELRKILRKKEQAASKSLEAYENESFSRELQLQRDARIEAQEKLHLEAVRREAKKRRRRESGGFSDSESSQSSSSSDGHKKTKSKKKKKKSKSEGRRSDKRKRVRTPEGQGGAANPSLTNNPFRLSTFFEMERE